MDSSNGGSHDGEHGEVTVLMARSRSPGGVQGGDFVIECESHSMSQSTPSTPPTPPSDPAALCTEGPDLELRNARLGPGIAGGALGALSAWAV